MPNVNPAENDYHGFVMGMLLALIWDLDARRLPDWEIAMAARNEAIPTLPCPFCPRVLLSYDEIIAHVRVHAS